MAIYKDRDFNKAIKKPMKPIEGKKPLDWAMEKVLEKDIERKELDIHLNKKLREIQKIDNKIDWFNKKIAEEENKKQELIKKMEDLMDLAMISHYKLKDGFYIIPDDKRKIEIKDIPAFLKWLKINKEPQEVLDFFNEALKITNLKSFCDKEANKQRMNGVINPKIDGVDLGLVTYRRYTTGYKKEKKK